MLTPFLRQGPERRERVIYVVVDNTPESILGYEVDNWRFAR